MRSTASPTTTAAAEFNDLASRVRSGAARAATVKAVGEEAPLPYEVRRPLETLGSSEPEVGGQRIAHRVNEPVGALRLEAVLPPEPDHLHPPAGAVDPRLDAADEPVAEEDR